MKKKSTKRFLRKLHKGQRGQAMASYAIITALLLGTLLTMSMVILPEMMDAMDSFTASMYWCINAPIP